MPKVSPEALQAFSDEFDKCFQRVGGGKLSISAKCLRELVRANRDVARRFAEVYCLLAQGQPSYLKTAYVLAAAFQAEFDDDSLVAMVTQRADALGAAQYIREIRIADSLDDLMAEPPERAAGRDWWRSTQRSEARCDGCSRPMRRGEGYVIKGRVIVIGKQRFDLGEELVCQECFDKLRQS